MIKVASQLLQLGIVLKSDQWTQLGQERESAGGNHQCVLQASLSANSQRRPVVSAHRCGSSDAMTFACISGSPWLHFRYARQKLALLLHTCLTVLLPSTPWFDLLQSRSRSKDSHLAQGLQPVWQTHSSMQSAATPARGRSLCDPSPQSSSAV